MNDKLLKLLKNSSETAKLKKEKRDLEEKKSKEALERFAKRADDNSKVLMSSLLKRAIKEYINDPSSIIHFFPL